MTVAEITWSQISRDTKWACGARNPVQDGNTLFFQVTITRNRKHKVYVTLDPSDTYTVKLISYTGLDDVKVEKEASDIYCDQLSELIYDWCNR